MFRVLLVACAVLALAVAERPLKSLDALEKALKLDHTLDVKTLSERVFDEKRLQKVSNVAEKLEKFYEMSEYQTALYERMQKIVAAEKEMIDNAKLETATEMDKNLGFIVEHIQLLGQRTQSFETMFYWMMRQMQQIRYQNINTPQNFYPRPSYTPNYWPSYRSLDI